MKYLSTRDKSINVTASRAIIKGLSSDGGLFVPSSIPKLSEDEICSLIPMTYNQRAASVLKLFLTDFTDEEINTCVNSAYNKEKFETESIAPVYKLDSGVYILELWHGPTCAFKDMALQILPHLLVSSLKKNQINKEVIILVATSGDTGKAALEGFADVEKTRINVFYPLDGVSGIQKLQMVTQKGNNVNICAVKGNFDDAQNGVKAIFTDEEFLDIATDYNFILSSANSINWGRLVPQIVYYFSAYADMLKNGEIQKDEKINIVVPTGNFGNILAAYYAKSMGLAVNKLICASNSNNVLTDFIKEGVYDRNRDFKCTMSPSMDILISSNLERLLFDITAGDVVHVKNWMTELAKTGRYEVHDVTKAKLKELFWADFASEQETSNTIKTVYSDFCYVMDTHTAVAKCVYDKYKEKTGDNTATLIAATASPFKFGASVMGAIAGDESDDLDSKGEFDTLAELAVLSGLKLPQSLAKLKNSTVIYNLACEKNEMKQVVSDFLRI